jgi:hypothetical protein
MPRNTGRGSRAAAGASPNFQRLKTGGLHGYEPQGHRWLCLPLVIAAVWIGLAGGALLVGRYW